ncbi:MAG: pilin [Candidatus Falkowbacteria bacterium]
MKINKKQIFSGLILSFAFLFISFVSVQATTPVPSSAGGAWDAQVGMDKIGEQYGEDSQSPTSLMAIIVRLINYSLILLGVIFLVLFVMSGYQWMTAGGNEDSIKTAKSRMTNAVIGLVVVLMSWTITYFVLYKIVLNSISPDEHWDTRYDVDTSTY